MVCGRLLQLPELLDFRLDLQGLLHYPCPISVRYTFGFSLGSVPVCTLWLGFDLELLSCMSESSKSQPFPMRGSLGVSIR